MSLLIGVPGRPAPQGSFRPMVNKHTGKPVLVAGAQSAYLRYRADLRTVATNEMARHEHRTLTGGVGLYIVFTFPRPKDHWFPVNSRRDQPVLKPGVPTAVVSSPDVDKLLRSVMDALTGVLYADDAQVVAVCASKRYDDQYASTGYTAIAVTHEPEVGDLPTGVTH